MSSFTRKTVAREGLGDFIRRITKDSAFYGPVKNADNVLLAASDGEMVELDYANSKIPLKSLFFPQNEMICSFEDGEIRNAALPDDKVVVFGPRPCDVRALLVMDKVFGSDVQDPYYLRRRDNTTVIALACKDPARTCFCTAFGGSPSGGDGADVLASDLGEVLLLEALTGKGEHMLKTQGEALQAAKDTHLKTRDELAAAAEEKIRQISIEGVSKVLEDSFSSSFWDEIHKTCLGCGVCTYLCPTCHCFAFAEERRASESEGVRFRLWDSCQYPAFTLEASGHNPRVSSKERMRQRIMHKFSYYPDNFDEVACVGCGRCVENCPVNLDLREVVSLIREESR